MKPAFSHLLLFLLVALRNSGAHFFCCCCHHHPPPPPFLPVFPSRLISSPLALICSRPVTNKKKKGKKNLDEGLINAFVQRQPASVSVTRRRRPVLRLPSSSFSSEAASRAHTCQKYKHAAFFERKRCHGEMCAASEGRGFATGSASQRRSPLF